MKAILGKKYKQTEEEEEKQTSKHIIGCFWRAQSASKKGTKLDILDYYTIIVLHSMITYESKSRKDIQTN